MGTRARTSQRSGSQCRWVVTAWPTEGCSNKDVVRSESESLTPCQQGTKTRRVPATLQVSSQSLKRSRLGLQVCTDRCATNDTSSLGHPIHTVESKKEMTRWGKTTHVAPQGHQDTTDTPRTHSTYNLHTYAHLDVSNVPDEGCWQKATAHSSHGAVPPA